MPRCTRSARLIGIALLFIISLFMGGGRPPTKLFCPTYSLPSKLGMIMMPQTGFQDKASSFNLNAAKGYMCLRHCHNNRSIMQRSVSLAPVGESHGISVFFARSPRYGAQFRIKNSLVISLAPAAVREGWGIVIVTVHVTIERVMFVQEMAFPFPSPSDSP